MTKKKWVWEAGMFAGIVCFLIGAYTIHRGFGWMMVGLFLILYIMLMIVVSVLEDHAKEVKEAIKEEAP